MMKNKILSYIIMSEKRKYLNASTRSGEKLNAYLSRHTGNNNILLWKRECFFKDKNRKIAWVKFYNELSDHHETMMKHYELQKFVYENYDLGTEERDDNGIARNIQNEMYEMMMELKKEIECPICLEPILSKEKLHITSCGHKYCVDCRSKITECAMCRKKIGKLKK